MDFTIMVLQSIFKANSIKCLVKVSIQLELSCN